MKKKEYRYRLEEAKCLGQVTRIPILVESCPMLSTKDKYQMESILTAYLAERSTLNRVESA